MLRRILLRGSCIRSEASKEEQQLQSVVEHASFFFGFQEGKELLTSSISHSLVGILPTLMCNSHQFGNASEILGSRFRAAKTGEKFISRQVC
jgi:hypothetical protein